MNILARVVYGSRLYGTSTPESDADYRAVYLPPLRDVVLGRAKDAWTDPAEEDTSYFSLTKFLDMAVEGQSIAIEMIAAPPDKTVITSPIWDLLHNSRNRFYTKSMHSFLGFSRTMASKYSCRADRMGDTERVMLMLDQCLGWPANSNPVEKLGSLWDILPETPNLIKTTNPRNTSHDNRVYNVCGRELQATVTIAHALSVVKGIYDTYGSRVKNAKEGRIEWKSLSHAFRAALQAKEIVETGDLIFPLKDAEWLRDLKLGKIDFVKNELDKRLDDLILEVQHKMDESDLPKKGDREFADSVVLQAYNLS